VFLLKELCARPTGPGVERAWRAIEAAAERMSDKTAQADGRLWKRVQRLMAKAEAERLKALTEQQDASSVSFGQDVRPFSVPDGGLCVLDIGTETANPSHSHVAQNGPESTLEKGATSFLPTPGIPTAEDPVFIGGHPPSESPGYSGLGLQFHGTDNLCSTTSSVGDYFTDPLSSRGAMSHGADNSLDWVMLDDMEHQAVPQMGLPVHRYSDEFPHGVKEWVDWF
jgi:hypothetical protein